MRKKTYFALALLGAVVGMSAFSSCKDDYDTYTEVRNELYGQSTLIKSLQTTIAGLESRIAALEAAKSTCGCDNSNFATKTELSNAQTLLQGQIDALKGDLATLQTAVNQNTSDIAGLLTDLQQAQADIDFANAAILAVGGRVENLENVTTLLGDNVESLLNDVAGLQALVTLLQGTDNDLQEQINALRELREEVDEVLAEELEAVVGSVEDLESDMSALEEALNEKDAELEGKIADLQGSVAALQADMAKVKAALQTMITGITLNATDNSVIGSINTPVGIRTNLLLAYYGKSVNDLTFPTDGFGSTVGYINEEEALTDAEAAFITAAGVESVEIVSNDYILASGNNAGTLYLTINPNTVDYTGKTLQLVNSQGVAPALTLSPLKLSDHVLSFGMTRANENGFYEAGVSVTAEDIESGNLNKFELNKDEVVNTAKTLVSAIKGRKITDIAKTVYDMVNPDLDAYAMKASYENVDGEVSSIFSDYNVAAAAVNAPSFGLIDAIPHVWTIPGYERAQNAIDFFAKKINKMFNKVNLPSITIKDITLAPLTLDPSTLEDFVIRVSTMLDPYSDMYVIAPVTDNGAYVMKDGKHTWRVYDRSTGEAVNDIELNDTEAAKLLVCYETNDYSIYETGTPDDYIEAFVVYDLASSIEELINDVYDSATAPIDDVAQMVADINKFLDDVNSVLAQLNSVQSTVNDLASSMHNVLETLNAKVAGFINNLGYYVKPALLCNAADGTKMLSRSINYPSEVSADFDFIATSMSAEVIVPFAKKHLAVVNVYNMDRTVADNALALATSVNNSGKMNTVLDGAGDGSLSDPKPANFVAASGFQAGYIYEVAYSVVDYAGYVSTRRYYVTVK